MEVVLTVVSGKEKAKSFTVQEHDTIIFGRGRNALCRIQGDPAVSRHHFPLEVNLTLLRIKDLGSRNRIRINGERFGGPARSEVATLIDKSTALEPGDRYQDAGGMLEVRHAILR